jgi:pSer/pThr/pTyr-binding forkhead associated (FHA) protein
VGEFMSASDSDKSKRPLPSGLGALIEFTSGGERGRKVPLTLTRTVLGRKFGDILVRDIKVSSSHAALEFHGGEFRLIDLDSSNGTFLGKRKVRQVHLPEREEVRIGLTSFVLYFDPEEALRLTAERPQDITSAAGGLAGLLDRELMEKTHDMGEVSRSLAEMSKLAMRMEFSGLFGPVRGKSFRFKQPQVSIGRTQSDLNLPDPDVSRKHALLEMLDNGQIILRDLASRNGTFVNDHQITNRVLQQGDRVRMGKCTLLFSGVTKE